MSAVAALVLLLAGDPDEASKPVAIRGARIGGGEEAVILVEEGRIRRIAPGLEIPAGAIIVDAPKGAWAMPGFVDAHSHLGSAFEIEESAAPLTPEARGVDAFSTRQPEVMASLGSGVTLLGLAPGNGNVLGGRIGILRLNGLRYDQALLRPSAALKASVGAAALKTDREPTSRPGAAALLREALKDPGTAKLPLFIHAPGQGDAMLAIETGRGRGAALVILHLEEASGCATALKEAGVSVALRALTPWDRKALLEAPGLLERAGVPVAFVSDAPRAPEAGLRLSAALAHQYGMSREGAFRALTTVPARMLGLEAEAGALEEGRFGDVVVWTGDPLSLSSSVHAVVAGGRLTWKSGGLK